MKGSLVQLSFQVNSCHKGSGIQGIALFLPSPCFPLLNKYCLKTSVSLLGVTSVTKSCSPTCPNSGNGFTFSCCESDNCNKGETMFGAKNNAFSKAGIALNSFTYIDFFILEGDVP